MSYQRLLGGLSNDMYVFKDINNKSVYVLRKYRDKIDRTDEIKLVNFYSSLYITPKILSISSDSRTEEYFDGTHPTFQDLLNDNILESIIDNLIIIHTRLPEPDNISIIYSSKFPYMLDKIKLFRQNINIENSSIVIKLTKYFEIMCEIFSNEIVMCHNDIHIGNIMISNNDNKIILIDLEFCNMNHWGYDLANFICVTKQQLEDSKQYDSIYVNKYIKEFTDKLLNIYSKKRNIDIKIVRDRTNKFTVFSHFIWYLWALNLDKNTNPDINFDYKKYAKDRLTDIDILLY